ncbi:MAG TPA: hypothetical protein PLF01_08010, partial [Alphaproteobacteria bacterium]|nr:hypothetical protein [Alphaproteobacteria bacterium]
MRIEGAFGLASFGKGYLMRDFARYSANYMISDTTGALMSMHNLMPAIPHFSSGSPPLNTMHNSAQGYYSPMYELMRQQLEFQRQQLEFQRQQQMTNKDQAGLIKDMLSNLDKSFSSMMDIMSRMVSASAMVTPPPPPQRHRGDILPANDATNLRNETFADNVVRITSKQ